MRSEKRKCVSDKQLYEAVTQSLHRAYADRVMMTEWATLDDDGQKKAIRYGSIYRGGVDAFFPATRRAHPSGGCLLAPEDLFRGLAPPSSPWKHDSFARLSDGVASTGATVLPLWSSTSWVVLGSNGVVFARSVMTGRAGDVLGLSWLRGARWL